MKKGESKNETRKGCQNRRKELRKGGREDGEGKRKMKDINKELKQNKVQSEDERYEVKGR